MPAPPADQVQQLQAQVAALQAQIAEALKPNAAPSYQIPGELFPGQYTGQLDAATWSKLKTMAGPSPARLGRSEAGPKRAAAPPAVLMDAQAEYKAEAIADDEFAQLAASLTDPMQKLMALQMKQQQELISRLAPKGPQDALLTHALTGWGSEPASSSAGVRGCTAREAYLKQWHV